MVCMRLRCVRSVVCGCILCVGQLEEEIVAGMFLTCMMHRGLQFCLCLSFLSLCEDERWREMDRQDR